MMSLTKSPQPELSITADSPERPAPRRRNSLRAPAKDYREHGAYFVTICTHDRALILEDPAIAAIANAFWLTIPDHFAFVELNEFVVMPNHVHGILWIVRDEPSSSGGRSGSLSAIIGSYKSIVTREVNRVRNTPGAPIWQRNFYDHVIRTDKDLLRIQQYIIDNPARWAFDHDNPQGQPDFAERSFWDRFS